MKRRGFFGALAAGATWLLSGGKARGLQGLPSSELMVTTAELTATRRTFEFSVEPGPDVNVICGQVQVADQIVVGYQPPNRVVAEYDTMMVVGGERVPVHHIELDLDFVTGFFFDVDVPASPLTPKRLVGFSGVRPDDVPVPTWSRRVLLPWVDLDNTGEDLAGEAFIEHRLPALLAGYREVGFDSIPGGPDQPLPRGTLIRARMDGKRFFAGAFTGYELTTKNMVLTAPARAILG